MFLLDRLESFESYQLVFPFYYRTLEDLLFKGNNDNIAARFMQDVTQGLAYLHERDIIHCDISPSNILMGEDGRMVVSDFGCAQKNGYWAESEEAIGTW